MLLFFMLKCNSKTITVGSGSIIRSYRTNTHTCSLQGLIKGSPRSDCWQLFGDLLDRT